MRPPRVAASYCINMADVLFHNGRVLTIDSAHPVAAAVLARDGVIAAVGDDATSLRAQIAEADEIDCGGGVLAPAFIDAHCHLLATAARMLSGSNRRRLRAA